MTSASSEPPHGSTFDPILSLASGLDAVPSTHAVLLGAGVSIAAGVPSAWGVQQNLIRRISTAAGEGEPDEPHDWFRVRFGREATYESLMEEVAPTPHDRQGLLRDMFEPEVRDHDASPPAPSITHRALARLAAAGAVRVFLTLNFDHLMQRALREVGIEPVVVRSVDDLAGLAPLHTLRAVVVHLHGDYLTPTAMKNTKDELSEYDRALVAFLQRVLADHALLVVGWSAEYDPALRSVVQSSLLERFTSYWFDLRELGPRATELATACRISFVRGEADELVGRLSDAHAALGSRRTRHPLSLADAVAAVKRELGGGHTLVAVHDRLRTELSHLRDLPELALNSPPDGEDYDTVRSRVEEATLVAAGLIAACAYWGDESTDRWWLEELTKFTPNGGSGLTDYLRLPRHAGSLLYQAAAVAAIAANRYDLVGRLFRTYVETREGRSERLPTHLATCEHMRRSADAASLLAPIFVDHLVLGRRAFELAWETHDIMVLVRSLLDVPHFEESARTVRGLGEALTEATAARDEGTVTQAELDETYRTWGRKNGALADSVDVGGAHVRYSGSFDVVCAPHADALRRQVLREGERHPWARQVFGSEAPWLPEALEAVSLAVGRRGHDVALRKIGGRGAVPLYLWIDTGHRPED